MRIIGPAEDRAAMIEAAKPAPLHREQPPYGPGTPTGLTNAQQAALYASRKHRRQRLGVVPRPPLVP